MVTTEYRPTDLTIFLIANIVNVLMIGIFMSRPFGLKGLEHTLGAIQIALIVPAAIAIAANLRAGREWWTVALPALLIAFLLLELVLDYILKVDFRHTRLLGPYLGLFYLALMGMIGYSFAIGKRFGAMTLVTYFLQLVATWYSYTRVGHG